MLTADDTKKLETLVRRIMNDSLDNTMVTDCNVEYWTAKVVELMPDQKDLQEKPKLANDAIDAISEARQKDVEVYREQLNTMSLEKERAVLKCEQLVAERNA